MNEFEKNYKEKNDYMASTSKARSDKNKAAQALGKLGGLARAKIGAERLREIAMKGVAGRRNKIKPA